MDKLRLTIVENDSELRKFDGNGAHRNGGATLLAACSFDLLALCREGGPGALLLDVPDQAVDAREGAGGMDQEHPFAPLPGGEAAQYYVIQPIGPDEARRFAQSPPEDAQQTDAIHRIMLRFGIPAHIQGSQYLCEAVRIVCHQPSSINRITKELYPAIAGRFFTTPSKVERSIRHAISVVWQRERVEQINALFGFNVCTQNKKPTNGEFIALMASAYRMRGA